MPDTIPVALITGASRGLGRGIATKLASLGMSIIVNYARNRQAAEETAALCQQQQANGSQKFIPMKADVGAEADRSSLFGQILEEFGRIDAFISNAGIGPKVRADITETSLESFDEVLRVNLVGPYFLTQRIANYWIKERPKPILPNGFTIIYNSSISADTASLNRGEYCISKAGLAMVTQLWALRLAEADIKVYELRPGVMATDMTSKVKEKYNKMFAQGVFPQRRWGLPEDMGRAVAAILMGNFPYSTGEVIHIDGGFHLRRL